METRTAADFSGTELVTQPRTALVVFLADWCPVCRMYERTIEKRAPDFPVPVLAGDVTSEASPLWDDLRIRIVPTMVLFRDGKPVWRKDGVPGLGLRPAAFDEAAAAAAAPTAE